MNKKKIEKIITHNIESNGDFNKIKDSIVFSKKENKRVSFKDFIFNYRTLRLVCPLLAIIIMLPFLPMMFSKNSNVSNGSMNCSNQISENNSYNEENVSSNSSYATSYWFTSIEVYGIIVINNEEKMFYTDESYGYYNELNKGKEFNFTGLYKLDKVNNYDELELNTLYYASIITDVGFDDGYYQVGDIYEIKVVI